MITLENQVIWIAAEELGLNPNGLSLQTVLRELFTDSLEYMSFITALGRLGVLSDEAVSKAETLGDLANAIVLPN